MQTNGNVIRNQTVPSPAHVWASAEAWARAFLRRDVIVDGALTLITLDSVGFVLLCLHRVFANYTVTGF